ncbi:serine hydrolase [Candidatus Gottesmanbacteria bacterium]|nr:serine hydrolase [Candidatus Gottesmanbacteria bacterium]
MAKEHAEWPERRSMSVVYFQNKLWMFGGWSPTSGYSSNIWQSSDGVTWTKVVESAPWPPREGQTAEVFQNKIWMVGGVNYDNRETKNDIWWSDDGIKWQEVKSKAPWSPRWDHALAVFKGKLFLSGGMNLNGETFKDVWSSGDGLNWELVNPAPPWRERQGHSLVVLNDKLWTIGSLPDMSKREINDVWYTDDGLTWQKTETDPRWIGREDHSVLVFKDRIFVFGGMDSNWRWKNDVWISSPANTDSDKNDSSLSLPMGSFISVLVTQDGEEKVLAQQDTDKKLPIASITKLMTALVASGEYRPDEVVTVSSNSLRVKGVSGVYRPGDELFFSDALRAMLVASHNELAEAMSERAGTSSFVKQMNEKKSAVRMINTEFVNPIGTDSDIKSDPINLSTAYDIYKLARYIEESRPDIFFITNTEEFNLSDANGNPLGIIKNTNKLLGRDDLPFKIIGGKTGETPRAKKNLVIVANAPCEGKIYSVILGSEDNFGDMEKLLRYSKSSHDWNCLPR